MSDLDQEIGKRLREARKLQGFRSARAFAIKLKIPESTYSQHETGKRSLNPKIVLHYCECLQIDPGWLLSGKESGTYIAGKNSASIAYLNVSNQRVDAKSTSKTISDNLVTVDIAIFKDILKKTIDQYTNHSMEVDKIETLIECCLKSYNTLISTDYKVEKVV